MISNNSNKKNLKGFEKKKKQSFSLEQTNFRSNFRKNYPNFLIKERTILLNDRLMRTHMK